MQIVRTIVWVLLLVALLIFSVANWQPTVEVRIWENLLVETKIPAIVIVSFLIGFVPMWLVQRGTKWHYRRRVASLENAVRTATEAPPPAADVVVVADPVIEAAPELPPEPEPEPRDGMFLRDEDLPPPGTPRP